VSAHAIGTEWGIASEEFTESTLAVDGGSVCQLVEKFGAFPSGVM
jgi:hypothetical protein